MDRETGPACGFTWTGAHGAQHTCDQPEHGYEADHMCGCNASCAPGTHEALNDFEVYRDGVWFRFGVPPTSKSRYSRAQAVRLAAWLYVSAGCAESDEFEYVVKAVRANGA